MLRDWDCLCEETQLALSSAAMLRALDSVAEQAELLAGEIEAGFLIDHGGPDALRLLAALVRETGRIGLVPAGSA